MSGRKGRAGVCGHSPRKKGQLCGLQLGLTGSTCVGYKHRGTPSGTAAFPDDLCESDPWEKQETENMPAENEKETYTKGPLLFLYLATVSRVTAVLHGDMGCPNKWGCSHPCTQVPSGHLQPRGGGGGSAAKDGGKESRVQDALWRREGSLKDSRGFLSGGVGGEAGTSGWLMPAWAPG